MSSTTVEDIRGEIKDDPESLYLMDHPDSDEQIPILDMAPYFNGEPGGREKVAAQLREISMTVGFFYVKNHGIPQDVLDNVFAESRRFHSLPAAEKNKIPIHHDGQLRLRLSTGGARAAAHQHEHYLRR